ncbi:MAG: hypothetical protein QOE70_1103 [Chthoniobacter sp.]|jgi:hypothetical protein|nr:hypothetical protein [Chthoniobacter sp.]
MVWSVPKTLLLSSLLAASLTASQAAGPKPGQEFAPGVRLLARMSDLRITESSGVVASRRYRNVFWTHNDGGGAKRQVLYAIDRDGNTRTTFSVTGSTFKDWEDIAIDDAGHLYLGDLGNNDRKRDTLAVYEIDEPNPNAGAGLASVKQKWRLKFPNAPFDCESLFIWKDYGYVISKVFDNAHAQIFRFLLKESNGPLTLELVATTKIESPVTGADISTEGKLLGLVAKDGAYVFRINGDVARVNQAKPHFTKLKDEHIEGCCFVPDGLLVTSERRTIFLFTDPAFRGK